MILRCDYCRGRHCPPTGAQWAPPTMRGEESLRHLGDPFRRGEPCGCPNLGGGLPPFILR